MRRSFPARTTSNPLPPLTATDTETKARLHCLPSCCMVHCFNDLCMLVLLGLCKCMNVQALLSLRLVCAPFASTHSLNPQSTPVTLRLSLTLFSPYPSKLFRPFLLFFVASLFASDIFAFVGNVADINQTKERK